MSCPPLHIGLAGRAGAGKDTVAGMLVEAAGGPDAAVVIALADPLKRICRDVFGFDEGQLWSPSERRAEPPPDRTGPTAREALQRLGDWGRAMDPDVWIDKLLAAVSSLGGGAPDHFRQYDRMFGVYSSYVPRTWRLIVTPDVRFPNEAACIRRKGGIIWSVERKDAAPMTGGIDGHESEVHVADLPHDAVVRNHGTLDDLRHVVRSMLLAALAGQPQGG